MKPNWQQEQMRRQQEQMHKQQEQLRRQQQMAAWAQQKKEQEQLQRQRPTLAGEKPPKQPVVKARQSWTPTGAGIQDPFARVEAEVTLLRGELNVGRLNKEQFKDKLKDLMMQDKQGTWWMMGVESGEWYRREGADWVRSDPPVCGNRATAPSPASPGGVDAKEVSPATPAGTMSRPILGCITFFIGTLVTLVLGFTIITYFDKNVFHYHYQELSLMGMCAISLAGIVVSAILARKVWRG
jgi:hypothetical protein